MPEIISPERAPAADAATPAKGLSYAAPKPGVLRRWAGATRRWLMDTFSRDQIAAGIKQLAWVAPLTVLIWVYAEREQQTTQPVRFPVVARSSNPNVHVRVAEPGDGFVQAVLEGSQSRLEEVTGEVSSQDPVFVDVPPDVKAGVHSFSVPREILSRDPRFRGLTWVTSPNSTPARLEVVVDPIVEQTLKVEVTEGDAKRLEGATFNPAKVKVRMPSEVARIARAAHNGQLVAYADLGTLTDTTPGRTRNIPDVRVFVDGAESDLVRIEPTTVAATLTLREEDRTFVIPQVPVKLAGVPGVTNEYQIEFEPATVFNVKVIGPPRLIEQVAANEGADVRALVWVSTEDVDGDRPKAVQFILPDGIRLHPDSENQEVRVTMTRNTSIAE